MNSNINADIDAGADTTAANGAAATRETREKTKVHCLDGLVVVLHEEKPVKEKQVENGNEQGDLTVRGDEMKDAAKLQKVAQKLEDQHMEGEAEIVKDHVRKIVAKQLNEFDGFDR